MLHAGSIKRQGVSILFEPRAPGAVVEEHGLNLGPKRRGVIVMHQMCQFVNDHIIYDFERGHNQPPGETEGALAAT